MMHPKYEYKDDNWNRKEEKTHFCYLFLFWGTFPSSFAYVLVEYVFSAAE